MHASSSSSMLGYIKETFNTVMMTLGDLLKAEMDCGYTFYQSQRSPNVLQYADDTYQTGIISIL